jgi:DNA invertase Pin-like site-specific DNA recombinase
MKQFIGYIRCSTKGQSEEGHSIDTQKELIISYARLYNLKLVDIFIDDGFTGKNTNRPELNKAIDVLSTGKAEGLIVSKLDRLSRSVKDLSFLLSDIFNTVELHSVSERLDTSSPHGRLAINIIASVSQWEVETISQRTKQALSTLKKNNKYHGGGNGPRYGYKTDSNNNIIRNNEEMKIIRKAKALRAKGKSFRMISKLLADKDMFSRTGKPFSAHQIRVMTL